MGTPRVPRCQYIALLDPSDRPCSHNHVGRGVLSKPHLTCIVAQKPTFKGTQTQGTCAGNTVKLLPCLEVGLVFRPVCSHVKVDQGFILGC